MILSRLYLFTEYCNILIRNLCGCFAEIIESEFVYCTIQRISQTVFVAANGKEFRFPDRDDGHLLFRRRDAIIINRELFAVFFADAVAM